MSENYTVNENGVQLPEGQTFPAHGHVNIHYSTEDSAANGTGIHFDPNNNQPGGQWIGESFIPWSAFGLEDGDCVTWVQVHGFNYHFGEGGEGEVCLVGEVEQPLPEQPDAEFNEIVTEGAPDCDSVTVEITTVTESAGYWWNDSDEAWTLGDWFPVSEETTTRDATAEECPVQPDEGEEETPTEGEDEEQPVEEPEQPVDAEETPEEGVTVAGAEPEAVKPAVKLEVTPETFTSEAEPVTDTPELAQTGGDFVLPVVLGLSMLAGGVGLLFRKVKP